jgi:hypothetical protein
VTRVRLQRRTLWVLVGAQILSRLGGSAPADGALLAHEITGQRGAGQPAPVLHAALRTIGTTA